MLTNKELEEIKCLLTENNFELETGSWYTKKFNYVKDNCRVQITPLGYVVERTDYIQFEQVNTMVELLNLKQTVGCDCENCPGKAYTKKG